MATEDLRQKYEELVKRVDEAKKIHEKLEIDKRVLDARQEEYLKEAKVFGVSSLEELEEKISDEEHQIRVALQQLEEALNTGTVTAPTKPSENTTLTMQSLDDILSLGIR